MYSFKLHVGVTMSKSFALSMSELLIFEMEEVNEVLFLKANFFLQFATFGSATVIVFLTTIYASL